MRRLSWSQGQPESSSAARSLGIEWKTSQANLLALPQPNRVISAPIMPHKEQVIPSGRIEKSIFLIRGQKVMLDSDLAKLYDVPTKVFNQAVKRNKSRFPSDFMFQLAKEEFDNLRSQIVTLETGRGRHRKYLPYAFTEQGVAMLSSVLRSKRAVNVNIEIMRAFVRLREILATHKDLANKLEMLEKQYDAQFKVVFDAIRQLMTPPEPNKRKIGFLAKERAARYGRK
jgi:phage regulator Rha-like protein